MMIGDALFFLPGSTKAQTGQDKPQIVLEKVWESPDLLITSESVCYDRKNHLLYVSCINGNPTDKDGNGFISQLSLAGKIILLKWIDGLNAPKGMGIYNNKLYIADIDQIVEIDIENAVISKKIFVEGAKFLNDITIDPEGAVYVSDMSTNKIHRLKKGIVETWFDNKHLTGTNGLFYEDREILAGTKNGIFSIRIEDKRLWHLIGDTGGIDGLKADGYGNYIISDWMGKIQLVSTEDDPVILLNTSNTGVNAADIEYIPEKNLLLVPTFSDNRVMAYEMIHK
jgi:sugar lactone lactonase YvrE